LDAQNLARLVLLGGVNADQGIYPMDDGVAKFQTLAAQLPTADLPPE
jgi:hypothetical protein